MTPGTRTTLLAHKQADPALIYRIVNTIIDHGTEFGELHPGGRRSFEIDIRLQSPALAKEFATEFFTPAIAISRPGAVATTLASRARNALFACLSPLL